MKALCFGFHYSPTALDAAIEGLRASEVTETFWLLHPNRKRDVGPQLSTNDIRYFTADGGDQLPVAPGVPTVEGADYELAFLIDREAHFANAWDRSLAIETLRQRVFDIVAGVEPDVVVFGEVPHAAMSYLLYLIAKVLGIPTIVIRYGPTPFHVSAVSSIETRLLDEVSKFASTDVALSPNSRRYIDTLKGDYESARPAYSRDSTSLVKRARSRIMSNGPTFSPRLLGAAVDRDRLRRYYEDLAVELDTIDGPVVSVFLHLQPERTTCPEGGRYVQQWLVVSELSSALPAGWTIAVREHPATFVRGSRLVQSRAFYDAVSALPGVKLITLAGSAFDVVDRSRCVATVSGTIAFESAARGTPSLVFGNAVYRGCQGVSDAGGVHGIPDLSTMVLGTSDGLEIEEFLSVFDNSELTWAAGDHASIDVRTVRSLGLPFPTLLPKALSELGC